MRSRKVYKGGDKVRERMAILRMHSCTTTTTRRRRGDRVEIKMKEGDLPQIIIESNDPKFLKYSNRPKSERQE